MSIWGNEAQKGGILMRPLMVLIRAWGFCCMVPNNWSARPRNIMIGNLQSKKEDSLLPVGSISIYLSFIHDMKHGETWHMRHDLTCETWWYVRHDIICKTCWNMTCETWHDMKHDEIWHMRYDLTCEKWWHVRHDIKCKTCWNMTCERWYDMIHGETWHGRYGETWHDRNVRHDITGKTWPNMCGITWEMVGKDMTYIWDITCETWHDMWYMRYVTWHVTHVTHDIACDTWYVNT